MQDITAELKLVNMFVKKQFYLIKTFSTKINNQPETLRNKQFIERL